MGAKPVNLSLMKSSASKGAETKSERLPVSVTCRMGSKRVE